MGGEVIQSRNPRFEVRAAGSFVQQAGCPDESESGLSQERLERLCRGECHHPGDERHAIVAIEIVRVRPQLRPNESTESLIEDPWRRFDCPTSSAGCLVRFEDSEYQESGRPAVYYARALQAATPAINGANLRTELDAAGNAVRTSPCFGNFFVFLEPSFPRGRQFPNRTAMPSIHITADVFSGPVESDFLNELFPTPAVVKPYSIVCDLKCRLHRASSPHQCSHIWLFMRPYWLGPRVSCRRKKYLTHSTPF